MKKHYHHILFVAALLLFVWSAFEVSTGLMSYSTVEPPQFAERNVQPIVIASDASSWIPAPWENRAFVSERRFVCPCDGRTLVPASILETGEDYERCNFDCLKEPIDADWDFDGLLNTTERLLGSNPRDASDANLDHDGDGYGSLEEQEAGFDPAQVSSHPSYAAELEVGEVRSQRFAVRVVGVSQIGPDEWVAVIGIPGARSNRTMKNGQQIRGFELKIADSKVELHHAESGKSFTGRTGEIIRVERHQVDLTLPRLPEWTVSLDSWTLTPFEIHSEVFTPSHLDRRGLAW